MQRPHRSKFLIALVALGLLAGACSRSDSSSSSGGGGSTGGDSGGSGTGAIDTSNCPPNTQTAGISGDTINLVSSFPQSGLTAAFSEISKGYKAYFSYINDQGGVDVAGKKYKIQITDKDDMYNAATTAKNINELMGPDGSKAFAVFNVVGTSNNLAIRQSLNDNCVPDLFAATGSPAWGNPKYPWLIGSTLTPYTVEVTAYANYLKKEKPDAKVAMLIQNDDFGQSYEEGLQERHQGQRHHRHPGEVLRGRHRQTSMPRSPASSRHQGADTFINGATLLACPNALKAGQDAQVGTPAFTFVSGHLHLQDPHGHRRRQR